MKKTVPLNPADVAAWLEIARIAAERVHAYKFVADWDIPVECLVVSLMQNDGE